MNHVSEELLQIDPVCRMKVNAGTAKWRHEHEGATYYFCCSGCLDKFRSDPGKYLSPEPAPAITKPREVRGAIYTCPMHPEVRQSEPGPCPKCGMALEPE